MIRFTVPMASPSLNTFLYRHWRFHSKAKTDWGHMIAAAIPEDAAKAVGKRRLTIDRRGRGRFLDFDNMAGGAKRCILDNLKTAGLLVDDSAEWVEVEYKQTRRGKGEKEHTLLILEDL